MARPTVDGHRPRQTTCGLCTHCRPGRLNGTHQDPAPWIVVCGTVTSLIWAVCDTAARLELERIMRLRTVGNGWGIATPSPARGTRDEHGRYSPRHPHDLLVDRLDWHGITARTATDEDRDRWASLVRQMQGLEALEQT